MSTDGYHARIGGYRGGRHTGMRSKFPVVERQHKVRRVNEMEITSLWGTMGIERRTSEQTKGFYMAKNVFCTTVER